VFHCSLCPWGRVGHIKSSVCLEFPLDFTYPLSKGNSMRLPRLRRTPCEQCHPQSHPMSLTRYRALRYLARLPTHNAESGLLTLCTAHFLLLPSDPAVTSNALAIRIIFPLVGVTPAFRRLGLPAMPGKLKRAAAFALLRPPILSAVSEISCW